MTSELQQEPNSIENSITIPLDIYHRLQEINEILNANIQDDQDYEQASALIAQIASMIENYDAVIEALKDERDTALREQSKLQDKYQRLDRNARTAINIAIEQRTEAIKELNRLQDWLAGK